ncbi:hypothetical protein CHARACLAT_017953 [Characodon lateralis]|uniref:Uncharacterized protein n=1 Tax=Characodon lateralis TaxID=208331 RepID=A0ABU7DS84_9TELE|nr:hypothetical protein [Characodon lateralis]
MSAYNPTIGVMYKTLFPLERVFFDPLDPIHLKLCQKTDNKLVSLGFKHRDFLFDGVAMVAQQSLTSCHDYPFGSNFLVYHQICKKLNMIYINHPKRYFSKYLVGVA